MRLGRGELVDIEREVALGGPLHSKGVLILAGFLGGRFGLNRPLSLNARIVGDEDEIFLAGLADVGVMAGSAGDGNRIDARHSSIRNLTMTGLAASGRRDRRSVRPWLLARPVPLWVGGGIDRGQADHLGGDTLTQKPCHLIIQQPMTAFGNLQRPLGLGRRNRS